MTTVCAVMARSFSPDMFADLGVVLVSWTGDTVTRARMLTFDGDLSDEVVQQIRDRMTSRNDDDQAARADLRAKRDLVLGDDPISAAVRASINYQLGEGP